jgi:NAD+ synthase (glutamine-hydrolysing)
VTDSERLAENLGITFREIPIRDAVDAFEGMLADAFAGTERGVAEENIQARARGVTLMALSNKFDHLLLTTGNKSEMATGYATLYGDMSGGLAVLADVLKTRVYELAEHINRKAGTDRIPRSTIEKPPSAELSPDQQDTDTLPPYETLDRILRRYIEEKKELDRIVDETGLDRDLVQHILRLVDRNEYKRRQAPPGLRVSSKAFGIGRRLPIVMRWDREAVRTLAAEEPAQS